MKLLKSKKNKIILYSVVGVIAAALIVVFATPVGTVLIYHIASRSAYNADYENYKDEFNLVRDYIYEVRSDGEEGWFSVSYSDERYHLFEGNTKKRVECPDEVSNALAAIRQKAFRHKDARLNVIRYRHNDIAFCIENGQYALVYSPDGKMDIDELLLRSKQINSLKHKSISDGWYHVRCN
ncbi:MAG: hypothetical protein J5925_02405 [Clostridia bacterium]|nr:hypothetical protein [Clostridia bacterium]MBR5746967.1 hypothetical protein [Clostridia bacterium]